MSIAKRNPAAAAGVYLGLLVVGATMACLATSPAHADPVLNTDEQALYTDVLAKLHSADFYFDRADAAANRGEEYDVCLAMKQVVYYSRAAVGEMAELHNMIVADATPTQEERTALLDWESGETNDLQNVLHHNYEQWSDRCKGDKDDEDDED